MIAQAIRCEDAQSLSSVNRAPAKVALLGSGTVGRAVLGRLAQWRGTSLEGHLSLVFAANTRLSLFDPDGLDPKACERALSEAPAGMQPPSPTDLLAALGGDGVRILIDATADAEVAANHPQSLAPACTSRRPARWLPEHPFRCGVKSSRPATAVGLASVTGRRSAPDFLSLDRCASCNMGATVFTQLPA